MGIFKDLESFSFYDEDGIEVVSLKDVFYLIKTQNDKIKKILSTNVEDSEKVKEINELINGK
jgi:hypothetical protein